MAVPNYIMVARLLRDIREEVIGLLFNRYVFRTHQEIVRRNQHLEGHPGSVFCGWAQVVYAVTNAVGVRRLASGSFQKGDVNLVRFLDLLIQDPAPLWDCFERHHAADADRARKDVVKQKGKLVPDWQMLACRRLIGEDRKIVIAAAEKANQFASKRAAHSVPEVKTSTTFSNLDDAIDVVKQVTEKYTLLLCSALRESLKAAHGAGAPTIYPWLAQLKDFDLLKEMKGRKLPRGWDTIFLEPWATPETIALVHGDMVPPARSSGH